MSIVNCPNCLQPTEWIITVNQRPHCPRCARQTVPRTQTFKEFKENYLRARQTVPRPAVEGDIGNWLDAQWEKAHRVQVNIQYRVNLQNLERPSASLTLERDLSASRSLNTVLRHKIEELERQLKMYEPVSQYNGLSIEEWRTAALKAESEARTERGLRMVYMRSAERRRKRIDGMCAEAKVNEDFIGLLQQRLKARLAQLERVRQACDGQSLDP